jgi:hypothetical protein
VAVVQEPYLLGAHDKVLDLLELVGQVQKCRVQRAAVDSIGTIDQIGHWIKGGLQICPGGL